MGFQNEQFNNVQGVGIVFEKEPKDMFVFFAKDSGTIYTAI